MERKKIDFISLNIECDKHLDLVFPFLKDNSRVDIIALQEVFEEDFHRMQQETGLNGAFEAVVKLSRLTKDGYGNYGYATFTRHPILESVPIYYAGRSRVKHLPITQHGAGVSRVDTCVRRTLLVTSIDKDRDAIRVINTKFTWTPDGKPDRLQRRDIKRVLKILEKFDEFILLGDFNTPRGGEIYSQLSSHYQDCIPQDIKSTIDPTHHRRKDLELVVDGVFVTQQYKPGKVEVVTGLSDHVAIVGELFF